MQYRHIDKWGLDVSTFGLGCMRYPIKPDPQDSSKHITDEEQSIEMIRYAYNHGVNYFDTAYVYGGGESERILGKALKGIREKVYVATKLPPWKAESYADLERLLDESLLRLQTDYVDFYLLHSLGEDTWKKLVELDALRFLDEMKRKCKIKYACFSFHDVLPVFKTIIDAYDWDMAQVQFNILDENYQAGLEGVQYAASKNIPIVVMEPLRGGFLATQSQEVMDIWATTGSQRSPQDWAFRWVGSFPEVATILSGSSSVAQVTDSIQLFDAIVPGCMDDKTRQVAKEVQASYQKRSAIGCTGCGYCTPCPNNVDIPHIFHLWNDAYMLEDFKSAGNWFKGTERNNEGPSACIECGICEGLCPQHLPIIEKLQACKTDFAAHAE